MVDILEMLLKERESSYEVLLKNSQSDPIYTGHCPDCHKQEHKIEFKEEIISPTPIDHVTPHDHEYEYVESPSESESESQSESESESTSESESESESQLDSESESESESISESESELNEEPEINMPYSPIVDVIEESKEEQDKDTINDDDEIMFL